MTEAAVLIRASQIARELRPRLDEFSILTFQGEEIVLEDGNLRMIMGQLTNILRTQIRFALTYQERSAGISVDMVLSDDHPVEIPESWSSMGRHQLLELLKGTRFSVDRRRSWLNNFAAQTVEQDLLRQGATAAGTMRVPPPPPSPSGRTGSMGPPAKAARVPTPAVREPATPPPRGRSPGGAPGSSTDLPTPTAAAKAGRASTPPSKARPPAAAARSPISYISAEEWDNYFAGMNDVRGFAVDDDARPKAPPVPARTVTMTPREPDTPPPGHEETAAGGRARTRSPRRAVNTDGQWDYLNECDEAISQTLESLRDTFVNFPGDRLRLWRDASGQPSSQNALCLCPMIVLTCGIGQSFVLATLAASRLLPCHSRCHLTATTTT